MFINIKFVYGNKIQQTVLISDETQTRDLASFCANNGNNIQWKFIKHQ